MNELLIQAVGPLREWFHALGELGLRQTGPAARLNQLPDQLIFRPQALVLGAESRFFQPLLFQIT